jgi:hypothetical protein
MHFARSATRWSPAVDLPRVDFAASRREEQASGLCSPEAAAFLGV